MRDSNLATDAAEWFSMPVEFWIEGLQLKLILQALENASYRLTKRSQMKKGSRVRFTWSLQVPGPNLYRNRTMPGKQAFVVLRIGWCRFVRLATTKLYILLQVACIRLRKFKIRPHSSSLLGTCCEIVTVLRLARRSTHWSHQQMRLSVIIYNGYTLSEWQCASFVYTIVVSYSQQQLQYIILG